MQGGQRGQGGHGAEGPGGSRADAAPEDASDAGQRLAAVWEGARDGLFDWDLSAGTIRFSPRWKRIVGCAPGDIGERPEEWFRRVHPRDLEELKRAIERHVAGDDPRLEREFRIQHRDGGWRWVVCTGAASPGRGLLAGSLTDVTELRSAESRLLHELFHDPLTELPNRSLFLDRLGLALSRSRRRGTLQVAVLYLDLDRFRTINDSLGHGAGDELLVEVTRRLRGLLRYGDTLARLGGDKFGLLLDGVKGPREAIAIAEKVGSALAPPIQLHDHAIYVSCSTGIALSPGEGGGAKKPEDLLHEAITAMHRAKEDGATRHELFDPEMNAQAKERLRLEADLRHALERDEFTLHFQPIISFRSGELSSFEALMRWQHPERGFVRPDVFIPIAEENGLILPMGSWVLNKACMQMADWRARYPKAAEVAMAVNISGRQFEDATLVDQVGTTLDRTGLDADGLKLEMTESVVMARTQENKARLQELRDLGVKLLIDDFGTGYSSLASLHSFPLDTLKIDRSFVSRMEFEEEKAEIVRTILTLSSKLGMDAVAEGVETAEQLAMLRDLACEHGQGYYFSTAVDGESAAAWLEKSPRW